MFYDLDSLSNFIGIIGVLMVLIAYFLSQTGTLSIDSFKYLSFNLIGSSLITFSLCFHWNLSSFLVELAWSTISLIGLIKVLRNRIMALM